MSDPLTPTLTHTLAGVMSLLDVIPTESATESTTKEKNQLKNSLTG
jgi:hypothetical protein